MKRTALRRWALVAVVAALLVGVPAVVAAWPVSTPEGADGDPAVLRDRIAASTDVAWSGDAESRGALSLPGVGLLSDVTNLLAGVSRMRAWYAAPDRSRVDLLSAVGERDRYTTPDGQAVWDYGANLLTLVGDDPTVRLPRPDDLLPPQLARRLLDGTAPDDPVSALPARRVAGVDAAGLRVRPQEAGTTVGALDVWADTASGLPLRVEVHARGTGSAGGEGPPAITTAFTTLTLGPPDADALTPRRAPGAGLARSPTSDLFGVLGRGPGSALPATVDGRTRERPERGFAALGKYGTTLGQVIVVPLPPDIAGTLVSGLGRAGSGTTLSVPGGGDGALLDSGLLTLAVVRDGDRAWALSGLVEPAVLERGAADVVGGGA